jgi:glucosyl-dolichyl phosphate glucuronosyltransferase
MAERPVDLSVIVPTYNRAASLLALLRDLDRLRAGDLTIEIIVVDNGSSDETPRVVRRHALVDPRIRYTLERRRGASCARNAGIAVARAPILAFIDDDVRPSVEWAVSICQAFAEHPEIDCLGGRVEPRWPRTPPAWLTRALWGPLALQMGRGDAPYLDRGHASACLITANFACRAEVFRAIGGFSPEFQRDEDREFNLRLWRAGRRGIYDDSVVAYAEVQPERLTRRYHRGWHHVTGRNHARLYFRDTIRADGALDDDLPARSRLIAGVPGFLYRECAAHAVAWLRHLLTGRADEAFADECRLRYLASYFTTRWSALLMSAVRRVWTYAAAARRRGDMDIDRHRPDSAW